MPISLSFGGSLDSIWRGVPVSVQLHQIIEVDCKVNELDRDTILQKITCDEKEDTEALETDVDYITDECLKALKPRGIYKLFNPATCTLPPAYSEPAIKLVGTMMIFRGKSVYDKIRRASHCVLMAAVIGTQEEQDTLRKKLCYTPLEHRILDACFAVISERAGDMVNADIIRTALDKGLYTDDRLSPGEGDFPLETRSQILFYVQAEKRLGETLGKDKELSPAHSIAAVVGMYDKTQKGRKRACGRCKYREFCSIRAIGMNCHGGKGSFR